jgi:uncharacterized protein
MDVLTEVGLLVLSAIASLINGAIGYGFSSVLTPIALFWVNNRLLNPAIVVVELGVNIAMLLRDRGAVRSTFPRALPVMGGLLPGVLLGTFALAVIAPVSVRLIVYTVLLPLTILQLFGFRRPIDRERSVGPVLGGSIGFLYALTTISGPPLALYFRNQGLSKSEFRCTMAQVRVMESGFTSMAFLFFGFFTPESLALVPFLLLPVIVGIPVGAWLIARVSREFFARLVMGADGLIASYGLSRTAFQIGWISSQDGMLLLLLAVPLLLLLTIQSLRRLPKVHSDPEPLSPAMDPERG